MKKEQLKQTFKNCMLKGKCGKGITRMQFVEFSIV
jgi:hypothetical protein